MFRAARITGGSRTIRLTLLLAVAVVGGCGPATTTPASTSITADALDQMVVTFEGTPLRATVQAAVDAALAATNMSLSSENYSRAGSTLVALRKSTGVSEMDMLGCIPEIVNEAPNISFPDAAALCATELAIESSPRS